MNIAAHRGSRLHGPENTLVAYLSGYTAGADVLEMDLQLTKDNVLVMFHDDAVKRTTGIDGLIPQTTLKELRSLDFSRTFQPRNSPNFHYYDPNSTRKLPIPVFADLLQDLPEDVQLLVEMKHTSATTSDRRERLVRQTLETLEATGDVSRSVLYSKDAEALRMLRVLNGDIRIAAFDFDLQPADQFKLIRQFDADGLVTDLDSVLNGDGTLTEFGESLADDYRSRSLRVGAVLYPFRQPGLFTPFEYESLRHQDFVWSLSTDSMLETARFTRKQFDLVPEEPFAGQTLDRERFALGYAKANPYCAVTQKDGIRISIAEYDGPLPEASPDPAEQRLRDLELKLTFTAKDWPYYSGGGVGLLRGIRGDFAAEVDYTVLRVGQATTLEMAVLNVDPGAHRGKPPESFRHKDSFYDPHGAPPYVGVEHDEDDGFRINWNFGSEYDNNQYGRPVGDGKTGWDGVTPLGARLRLERRGPYFSAYYKGASDAQDWVCVGNVRNESMNRVVYLRCVAKRWRQEDENDPSQFLPIIPNRYVFRNLKVTRFHHS
jgi:hypothetical protein